MFQSISRPPEKSSRTGAPLALSRGEATGQTIMDGACRPIGLSFRRLPSCAFDMANKCSRLKRHVAILQFGKASVLWGRLAFVCSTQKRERTRSDPSEKVSLTTLCSRARLPFESLAARGSHLEVLSAELGDPDCFDRELVQTEVRQSCMVIDCGPTENRR